MISKSKCISSKTETILQLVVISGADGWVVVRGDSCCLLVLGGWLGGHLTLSKGLGSLETWDPGPAVGTSESQLISHFPETGVPGPFA